jgi:hypothetical protein
VASVIVGQVLESSLGDCGETPSEEKSCDVFFSGANWWSTVIFAYLNPVVLTLPVVFSAPSLLEPNRCRVAVGQEELGVTIRLCELSLTNAVFTLE